MAIINYDGMKNATAVKNQVRKDVAAVIHSALAAEYGEENVRKVGPNEYAAAVGEITVDGFINDIVITVKPTVKDWEDRRTDKKIFTKYNIDDEAEIYETSVREKEEEKKKKEEQKKKKIEKDKKAREEKKKSEMANKDNITKNETVENSEITTENEEIATENEKITEE